MIKNGTTNNQKNIKRQNAAHTAPIRPVAPVRIRQNNSNNQIISGYFIPEQSYRQMVIEKINTFLFCVLGFLVFACLVGYYFVLNSEIKLNEIRKETLALNYENEELQTKLDNLQSYTNIDKTVSKTNILQKAQQIMELSAGNLPNVEFKSDKPHNVHAWSLGY